MKNSSIVSEFVPLFKDAKWKKTSHFFFQDLNEHTLVYHYPFMKGDLLRVQYGVINRILNRIVWDLYGLPEKFGTPKQQLANSVKCSLYFTVEAMEIREPKADEKTARDIGEECLRNAERFSSIDKIRTFLDGLPPDRQPHVAADRLCVALADGDTATAKALIARAEKEHIGFDLSIFAYARNVIAAAGTR